MSNKVYHNIKPDTDFSDVDHVVVGSGIGGLTVASWLAQAGKNVVVLERHFKPGGFTHSFKREKGFEWDVGVHYIGNVGEGESLNKLFGHLTNYKLKWHSLGYTYDVVHIGNDVYELKAGEAALKKQLVSYFPDEEKAITAYLKLINKANKMGRLFFLEKTFEPILSKTLGWVIKKFYNRYSQKTTFDVLSSLTKNKRLIAVLSAQCGNYGLSPKYSSFAAHAIVVGHFINGGYYPEGGSTEMNNFVINNFVENGGRLFINATVDEIVVEKNKVQGVRLGDQFISCKSVISNAGVRNTFKYLISNDLQRQYNYTFKGVKPSGSCLCLYVGLDQSVDQLKLPKHNIWSFANENLDLTYDNASLSMAPEEFAYITFPSSKDSKWDIEHPGTSTIQAISMAHYDWFESYAHKPWLKRGKAYDQLKLDFEKTMIQKLEQLFPQIKGHIVVTNVSTPLSVQHFSNYENGEIYGLEHTPCRFSLPFLRPQTKIKGLRLVGQDITLVGVAGAMLSGILCAVTILKFGVWKIFKKVAKGEEVVA